MKWEVLALRYAPVVGSHVPSPLGRIIRVVRTGRQFGQRDRADDHLVRQQARVERG